MCLLQRAGVKLFRGLRNANYLTATRHKTACKTLADMENFTLYFALNEQSYAEWMNANAEFDVLYYSE